ncbi:hypothetical protein E1B28_010320 [Marasmius oreades]|uniref:Uncharacterized protein n=1 Tax=Marasmius oreades TaxID=181124 RepID=A0A9P7RXJ1_9AGAR|nr:uncharacterized protein E1B28_010320 [Marasmius oreades]KAG7091270.1 hypothetical protein E1B28_010320 [Marasmius oreades]
MPDNNIHGAFYGDNCPKSADASFDAENTFTGYGDISHSEITFLPSASSEVSPEKRSPSYRRNAKRQLPPPLKKNAFLRQEQMSGDGSIADEAQKAVISKPEVDFDTLFSTLRATRSRIYEDRPAMPYLKSIEGKSQRVRQEDTNDARSFPEKNSGTSRRVSSPLRVEQVATRPRQGSKPNGTPTTPTSPQSNNKPSKPWRVGPLPRRSPLPRWDLMDPDVILEGMHYRLKPGFQANLPMV